ncbi:MAG: RagB/SusD family nutrient uptake outer membrane protein [Dysgonamonadaceae bacterium]|jgi:hypothetical protein|nr:RagB/SusD family nutrient uptake outer membrane protein [Dysgonamonadaceae bacterium]
MKKYSIILFISALGLSSCLSDGDFLEYDESTSYEIDYIRKDFNRTMQFVTDIYSFLPTDFYSVGDAMRSAACDEGEYVWPTNDIHIMTDGRWTPLRTVDAQWEHFYKGIRACNLYLEEFNNSAFEANKYEQEYENQMIRYRNFQWEVRFLRAFFHFELLKRYGDVPLVKHTLTAEEANSLSRTPFDEVVQYIADECDTVKKYITPSYVDADVYKNEISRVSKAAAYALKSRVLLYAASPLHNPGNDPGRWKRAAQAAADVLIAMEAGEIFGVSSPAAINYVSQKLPSYQLAVIEPNNYSFDEIILCRRNGVSGTLEENNLPIGFVGSTSGNVPTHNLVEKYGITQEYLDGKAGTGVWTNTDPRLKLVVALHGEAPFSKYPVLEMHEGGANGLPKTGATNTGYYLHKFLYKDINLQPYTTHATFDHNFPLFRYGEIFLNYAEAVNECYGPEVVPSELGSTMTALEALNKIRSRTGYLPTQIRTFPAGTFPTKKAFFDELRDERARELAFEDHRFWDIRRWKIGAETQRDIKRLRIQQYITINPNTGREVKNYTYTVEVDENARVWDDKMYLYPIPQEEIDKNRNLLPQNPGWE